MSSRYPVTDAFNKSSAQPYDFKDGPSIKGNHGKQLISDEKAKESFWAEKLPNRPEVRFDLFEEAIVTFIGKCVFIEKEILSQLNWRKFLDQLKMDLGY